jgi:O-antigen ligase
MSEATARVLLAARGRQTDGPVRDAVRVAMPPAALAVLCVAGGVAVSRGLFLPLLAAILALAYAMLLVARPAIGLLVFATGRLLVEPWVQRQVAGHTIGELWGIALLGAVLVFLALTPRPARPVQPRFTLPLCFVALYALLTFWRPDVSWAMASALKLASWLLLALAVERIARTAAGQRMALRAGYAMAMLTVLAIGIAIAQDQYGNAYYFERTFVDNGQTPHGYVTLAALVLPFLLVALLRGRHVLGSLGVIAALCIGVVLSYVRTGYVALAVLLIGYTTLGIKRRHSYILIAALAGTAAIVVTVTALGGAVTGRLNDLSNLGNSSTAGNAGAGRVGFETAIMDTTFNSGRLLLIGGGALTTERITSAVVGNRVWAHNDFLEMLATGGVFLLLGYLALLIWLYRSFRLLARDPRQGRAARDVGIVGLLATGAFAVVSMFNGVVTSPAVAFAVLLGLARGMTTTPGATFLDRPERSRHEASTGR